MKNLSKLLSIFLIGSMLVTVGCSKYDDDIKALNNRVDDIESQMNTTISPLKTDLEAVKTQLAELVAIKVYRLLKNDFSFLSTTNQQVTKKSLFSRIFGK